MGNQVSDPQNATRWIVRVKWLRALSHRLTWNRIIVTWSLCVCKNSQESKQYKLETERQTQETVQNQCQRNFNIKHSIWAWEKSYSIHISHHTFVHGSDEPQGPQLQESCHRHHPTPARAACCNYIVWFLVTITSKMCPSQKQPANHSYLIHTVWYMAGPLPSRTPTDGGTTL